MGGKEVRYHQLCPRLVREGVDVHVFTMHWWDGPRTRVRDGIRYTAITPRTEMYVGDRRSILQAVRFSFGCLRLMRHRFDAIDADQMPYLPLFPLWLVAKVKRVPLMITWHEVWGREYWRSYLGPAGAVAAGLERLAMRLPDAVVAVTDETRDRLVAGGLPPERVRVLPNGVDRDAIGSAAPSAARHDLVYVGRLIEHKRVADLVDAIAILAAESSPVSCAVVGVGPERARLERQVAELGVGHLVTFLGTVDEQSAVFGLIKSAKAFVLPSVREGFGIVVAEALACGVPVITTDHADNQARHLVVDGVTGWLAAPDARSLAVAIRRATAERADLTQAATTLERCDWDRIASRLAGLYDEMGRAA